MGQNKLEETFFLLLYKIVYLKTSQKELLFYYSIKLYTSKQVQRNFPSFTTV